MRNISREFAPTAVLGYTASTAAASTDYSAMVDAAHYGGCLFTAMFASTGASTGTAAFSIVGTNTSTGDSTSYSTINGASVTVCNSTTAKAARWASIDTYLNKYRYLKAKVVRTSMIGTNGILAQRYACNLTPTTPGSTTIGTTDIATANVLVVAGT